MLKCIKVRGDKHEAEFGRPLPQQADVMFPTLTLKFVGADVFIGDVVFQEVVHRAGDLVGGSRLSKQGAALRAFRR